MSRVLGALRALAGSVIFRAVVTFGLLALVFSRLDLSTIADKVAGGDPGFGALAVLAVGAALVVGAIRWAFLLRGAEISLPTREIVRIYSVTSFANAFLPTSVGGDVARPWMVSRRGPVLVRAITTVLLERLVALVALLGLAWIGLALDADAISSTARGGLVIASLALGAAVVVLIVRPSLLGVVIRAVVPERFSDQLGEMAVVVRAITRDPRALALIMVQSVAFQVLVTMQLVFLAKMIGAQLPFGLAAVALALVTLAMLVPISIGGFGVREGSYVVILAGGGISHTDAVLISLLSVVALFIATLPGAVELIRGGFSAALTDPEQA